MSVVGIDIGNDSSEVALARNKGIDVLLNAESKRETPSVVAFTAKQRFMGTLAASGLNMNPTNSVFELKRLIGKQFRDPVLQRDMASMPCELTEAANGGIEINVTYLGEKRKFTPEQVCEEEGGGGGRWKDVRPSRRKQADLPAAAPLPPASGASRPIAVGCTDPVIAPRSLMPGGDATGSGDRRSADRSVPLPLLHGKQHQGVQNCLPPFDRILFRPPPS